ncbi:MAG TPA: tetratricopeptide repeat protein [Fluviicoccus sp.]|nr:tetratricopeptide repeat protein [Fluviicoccus sp.]
MKGRIWICLLPMAAIAVTHAAEQPWATFAVDSYRLGYEVYLQQGKTEQAFRVAEEALRRWPEDRLWLTRYAKAAEWNRQPAAALAAWLRLARKTNDREAWNAVARLAPSLLDDQALLAWQQQRLQNDPGDAQAVRELTQTFERLGQVREGLNYLEQLDRQNPGREVLDAAAVLAERGGEDERALNLLETLIRRYGPEESWVLRRSGIHYARGELAQAWSELQALENRMAGGLTGYWQTYAELSRILNHPDSARNAYRKLVDNHAASANDLQNYIAVLQGKDGLAAGHLAETLFHLRGDDESLLTALFLYTRERHSEAAAGLITRLTPLQLAHFRRLPGFLELRGQLNAQNHFLAAARADFEEGLNLEPDHPRLLQALIGIVIEQQDKPALERILTDAAPRAREQPALWGLWGSGWTLLEQPRRALPWQQVWSLRHPEDDLALLSLADTHSALGDLNRARQLREHVMARRKPAAAVMDISQRPEALQDALLALRLNNSPPDAGLMAVRTRLQQPDTAGRELALSWLLAHDRHDWADVWLQQSFKGGGPVWAKSQLALQQGDAESAGQDNTPERLPRVTRIPLILQAGHVRQAESLAFTDAEQYPEDDEADRLFQTLAFDRVSRIDATARYTGEGPLQRNRLGVAGSIPLSTDWRGQLSAERMHQYSRNALELRSPPDTGNRITLHLTRDRPQAHWSAGLSRTESIDRIWGASIGQDISPDRACRLLWRLDYNAEAPESGALLVAGAKDQLTTALNWTADERSRLNAELGIANFHSAKRQALGRGQMMMLDYHYRLFAGSSAQSLRLALSAARFQTDSRPLEPALQALVPAGMSPSSRFFMPSGYNQLSLSWALGDNDPARYSRVWRPVAEVGVNYADSTGGGYLLALGGAGPLFGNDRLDLSFREARGGQNRGDRSTEAQLAYRYFY